MNEGLRHKRDLRAEFAKFYPRVRCVTIYISNFLNRDA
ncbi:hypothetical protein D554_3345 [Bordetella holmesii 30539]|uniref:Uncharacterized protein n=2 Tax=Bordetella holmesii TaxID=35814 RepID=A0A158M397_9BORD|nr:hypothetical protein D560_3448 [Bordetella holmesii ATCC 51541]AIT28059.1 hypothetical protein D558_3419 [Bordetella holmesii 44057]EWM40840.1 hypothetical protein D555_3485 [Bordetella holmesii 35009]EWM43453.1 hypothetical protein D556_3414 [Bordetella holmesii 41130]EXF88068.1 hypothetical protein D554_3345 [Bordetella holmesii 30539]EXX94069.1 hypothetical protein D559_1478 [Bordetella holmesii 1058]KAK67679.1 hypothetical protein L573_1284 [Bordetella holmesii H620]KAK78334.1 hypothe